MEEKLFDFHRLLAELADVRPVFHSEADLKFALAWGMAIDRPGAEVRLEVPHDIAGDRWAIDLTVAVRPDAITGVELKYKTRRFVSDQNGEMFDLRNHSAGDQARYDVWKDVVRLESLVEAGQLSSGLVVVLTNDPSLWTFRPKPALDAAFSLAEGRVVSGETLTWAEGTGAGTKQGGREKPLRIRGHYGVDWRDYSMVETLIPQLRSGSRFRYTVLAVDGRTRA